MAHDEIWTLADTIDGLLWPRPFRTLISSYRIRLACCGKDAVHIEVAFPDLSVAQSEVCMWGSKVLITKSVEGLCKPFEHFHKSAKLDSHYGPLFRKLQKVILVLLWRNVQSTSSTSNGMFHVSMSLALVR